MQKRVGRYQLIEEIGKGQYGQVYKGLDLEAQNKVVAVKQVAKNKVNKSDLMRRLFAAEVQVMQTLNMSDHGNQLSLADFIETSNNYYLVVRFCKDGDLESRLKHKEKNNFSETESVFYLKQIMNGFTQLYKHKIMHRDFKQANIFLDGYEVIIGDFGFAKMGQDMATTKLGTPYNMAPEQLLAKGKVPYTSKADLWSIGVCFYQMLYGVLPFEAYTMDELKNEVTYRSGKNLRFRADVQLTDQVKDILTRLLEKDAQKRINWRDFFEHPIFKRPSFPDSLMKDRMEEANFLNTSNIVEAQFNSNREKINMMGNLSDILVLPDPLDLCLDSNNDFSFANNINKTVSKNQDDTMQNMANIQDNKLRYLHERNKQILLFATSKKVRELAKIELFKPKFNILLLSAICLCKEGILLNNVATNSLKLNINQYNTSQFNEWCASEEPKKVIKSFEEDYKTMKTYFEHLQTIVEDKISQGITFDMKVVDELKAQKVDFNNIHSYLDSYLISLYQYHLKMPTNLKGGKEEDQFLRTCGAMAQVLMMEDNFPYRDDDDDSVFDWKCFNDREKGVSHDVIKHRLQCFEVRKAKLDDEGCFIIEAVKKVCTPLNSLK